MPKRGWWLVLAALLFAPGCETGGWSVDGTAAIESVRIVTANHQREGTDRVVIDGMVRNDGHSAVTDVVLFGEVTGPRGPAFSGRGAGRELGSGRTTIDRLEGHQIATYRIYLTDVPAARYDEVSVWVEAARFAEEEEQE
jgi:hypothetical protein